MNKIKNSYNLVKSSLKFILKDPELLTYSIISTISLILILWWITIIWWILYPTFEEFLLNNWIKEQYFSIIFILIWIVYYFIFSFITFYFNTAIISSVQNRIKWNDNKFLDWIIYSNNNLGSILKWSLVNTFVNVILMIIENIFKKDSIIWSIISSIIWTTWNIATYFSFPIMILEKKWVKDAIKESSSLFKKTWWERAIIYVWVWLFFFILFTITWLLVWTFIYFWFNVIWIIFWIITWLFIILLANTSSIVVKTIVYNYTLNWSVPELIKNDNIIENIIK